MMKKNVKLGDVFYVEYDGGEGTHLQNGRRPAIVWQNNTGNQYSPNVVVIPITSAIKRLDLPTHVKLPAEESGLPRDSMALCENPMTIPMECLSEYVSHLPKSILSDVAEGSLIASAGIAFLDEERIAEAKEKAVKHV